MLKYIVNIVGVAAAALATLSASNANSATIYMNIAAFIDGQDLLIIHGNTLQWKHLDFNAVSSPATFDYPTLITTNNNGDCCSGLIWTANWPNGVASGALSAIQNWSPGVPTNSDLLSVSLGVELARDSLTISQSPSASNQYTTILDFNDDSSPGAAWYVGDLTFNVSDSIPGAPEPSTWAMTLLGFAGLGFAGYRRAKDGQGFACLARPRLAQTKNE